MIKVKWTTDIESDIFLDSVAIRHDVFIEEQAYPPNSDIDDLEVASEHLVLYEGGHALATARLYHVETDVFRIERVAVRARERQRGLGSRLIEELENKVKTRPASEIILKSEGLAIKFYQKLGYKKVGDIFYEYEQPHQLMKKTL